MPLSGASSKRVKIELLLLFEFVHCSLSLSRMTLKGHSGSGDKKLGNKMHQTPIILMYYRAYPYCYLNKAESQMTASLFFIWIQDVNQDLLVLKLMLFSLNHQSDNSS